MLKNILKSHYQVFIITVLGLFLRLWHLTSVSLWHDEAFSALLIRYNWGEMFYRIGLDVHPPMYYIFLRIWHYVFGNSLYSLRGMSVLFGVATIVAVYGFVKSVFGSKRAAVLAAILVAVNPFQVQYVTEARMYTMGAFFAVTGAWSLVCALRQQKTYYETGGSRKPFLWSYALFALCSAIMIYTHYYLLFTVAALGLYGLWYHWRAYGLQLKRYGWVILSGVAILVSFVPWLKIFLFQYKQVGAGYWIPPIDRWSIPSTLWSLVFNLGDPLHWRLILLTILVLWIIVRVLRKYIQQEKWLILGTFVAPFAGSILFYLLAKLHGETSSVYLVRYFIFASSSLLILIALFIDSVRIKNLRILLTIVLVAVNIFAVWDYWHGLDVSTKTGMAGAAKYLQVNVEPRHKIYVGSSFEFFNYKYYNATEVKPLLFTDNHHVSDLPHFAGTAILTEQDLVLNFKDATGSGDTVWLLWTNGFGGSKPSVPSNWTQIDEKGFAEVRPYVGTWVVVTEYKVN